MLDSPLNVRVFAPLLLALGIAIVVETLVAGGGPFSIRFVLGVIFTALGGLRLYGAMKRRHTDA